MKIKLCKKREIWWPTRLGWAVLLAIFVGLPGWWWFKGEAFLSNPGKADADVLVVEGWIDEKALQSAVEEFHTGGYRYVVATGGYTGDSWTDQRWSYADIVFEVLKKAGISEDRIVLAKARDTELWRTYETALATQLALNAKGIQPEGLNVYTSGVHARRSCMVFDEVLGDEMEVGAIGWIPSAYGTGSWRDSSERAKNYAGESLGYFYELLWSPDRSNDQPMKKQ